METKKLMSITETPNELTDEIDIASPMGVIRMLRQADAQIFFGWRDYPGLMDQEILVKLERCILETAKVLRNENGKVIISGAGTSGRLAMFTSRKFNIIFKEFNQPPMFDYVMAGGNKALIKSQEGAEDDPIKAVKDFQDAAKNSSPIAFYGVTCGLSAPYIAGQLDYTQNRQEIFSCLLGFNPVSRSRNIPIEKWDKTFLDVATALEKNERAVILNPIIGPEPITGSTRMKGGSATKLLLETIFTLAGVESGRIPIAALSIPLLRKNISLTEKILCILNNYENAMKATYLIEDSHARIVRAGGDTLLADGHIYYIGEPPFGVLGLIDASECPPTFGANFGDVRGFIDGGWDGLLGPGKDISDVGLEYRIHTNNFAKEILPNLNGCDLVIALAHKKIPRRILTLLRKSDAKGARTACIFLNPRSEAPNFIDFYLNLSLPVASPLKNDLSFLEYSLKLLLNGLTTGAHILDGKVHKNRMIDLKISNNKLFYRTIGIISEIANVSEDVARSAILKAIYETDSLTEAQIKSPISQYVSLATPKTKIVPRAILMATGKFNLSQATERIKQEPIVRNIIEKLTQNS